MKAAYLTLVLGGNFMSEISFLMKCNVLTLNLLYTSAAWDLPKRIQLQPIDGNAARPMQGLDHLGSTWQ